MLTFAEFQAINERRCVEHFRHELGSWSLLEWAGALAGEVGEAANVAKKIRRIEQGIRDWKGEHPELAALRQALADEIGDAFAYLVLLASAAGLKAEQCAAEKFDRVSNRAGWDGPRLWPPGQCVRCLQPKEDPMHGPVEACGVSTCEAQAHHKFDPALGVA